MGLMLDALDGTTLARVSLPMAKAIRQDHRTPFARSLRHALTIFCQAHSALWVARAGDPHKYRHLSLVSRELPSFSKPPRLVYSHMMDVTGVGSDAIMSTKDENWWASSTGWWCLRGGFDRKHGKIHLKLAEYEQAS